VQLFDLATDIGERHNVASGHLDIAKRFPKNSIS